MLRQIAAITAKELRLFLKDPGALALTFMMPFMFILVMSTALAGAFDPAKDKPIPVTVVNEDQGGRASEVIRRLGSFETFKLETRIQGRPVSRKQAERLVKRGKRGLVLIFPENFSRVLDGAAPGPKPETARVQVLVDPATSLQFVEPVRSVIQGLLREAIYLAQLPEGVDALLRLLQVKVSPGQRDTIVKSARKSFSEDGFGSRRPSIVVERAFPPGVKLTHYPDTYQQNVPGYTIFGIFWIVTLLAGSVLREKRSGTFRRLRVAPLRRGALLAGKLLPYLGINLAQIGIMLGAGNLIFGLDLGRSAGGLILVCVATAATATGLGILVASLVRTEAQSSGLTTLLILSMAALGGCFVPRFVMPEWLRTVGLITPHSWALDGFQDLLVRGHGVAQVLPKVVVLAGFAIAFFGVGIWRFKLDE